MCTSMLQRSLGSDKSGKSRLNKGRQASLLEDFSEPFICQYLVGLPKWAPVGGISQNSLAAYQESILTPCRPSVVDSGTQVGT